MTLAGIDQVLFPEGLGMRLAGTKPHSQGMQLATLFKKQSLELCWQSFSSDFSPS